MKTPEVDWNARREEHRKTEWQLRERMLRFVETMIDRWESDAAKFGTLEAISKQVELVSKLGRLATDSDTGSATAEASGLSEDFIRSLQRIHETGDASEPTESATGATGEVA